MALEHGTDTLSRNVGNRKSTLANIPKHRRPHLLRDKVREHVFTLSPSYWTLSETSVNKILHTSFISDI